MGRVLVNGVAVMSTSIAPSRDGRVLPSWYRELPLPSVERATAQPCGTEAHLDMSTSPVAIAFDDVVRGETFAVCVAYDERFGPPGAVNLSKNEVLETLGVPVLPTGYDFRHSGARLRSWRCWARHFFGATWFDCDGCLAPTVRTSLLVRHHCEDADQ